VNFPGSILYRKRGEHEPQSRSTEVAPVFLQAPQVDALLSASAPAPVPPPAPAPADPNAALLDKTKSMYADGRYGDAAKTLRAEFETSSNARSDPRLLGVYAHALANQGNLAAALEASETWIERDKVDAAAHYLRAMVLQELGERTRSRESLQRAVYLQPDFALAHFALGNCARAEARHTEAQKHFRNAARVLVDRDAEDAVPESEGLNVGRLREIITALTAGSDA
jgi:chemotaxis protein methyltransferase CheR